MRSENVPDDNVARSLGAVSEAQFGRAVDILNNFRHAFVEADLDLRKIYDMISNCTTKLGSVKCGATT